MNYQQIYNNLIEKGKTRDIIGYSEKHHIIPRCLGGSDNPDNLVRLTPEEHYIAHQLLVKVYPTEGALLYAAVAMIRNRPSNKLYGWLRRKYASEVSRRQSGKLNNQFGTHWVSDPANKVSKRVSNGKIPEGWVKGRNAWPKQKVKSCCYCSKEFNANSNEKFCSPKCKVSSRPSRMYKRGYVVEVNGVEYQSISEAADFYKIGHETARMRFKSVTFPNWEIKSRA